MARGPKMAARSDLALQDVMLENLFPGRLPEVRYRYKYG